MHVDLVLLDQALGEGARLLGVAARRRRRRAASLRPSDAARGVDPLDVQLERLLLGIAEERGRSGDGKERADAQRLVGGERRQREEGGAGESRAAQGARAKWEILMLVSCSVMLGIGGSRRDVAFWYSGTKIRL